MKKFLVVVLSALLILALFIPAMADDNPVLTTVANKTTVKRGEEVTISVVLDKNITTRNVALNYVFDGSAFTYKNKSGKWDTALQLKGMNECDTFVANAKDNAATFGCDPAIEVSAGTIFTMTLIVKDDAPFGTYEINFIPGNQFTATCVAATVTVTHDCVPATTYTTDETHHWKACTVTGCDKEFEKDTHKFENACDTTCDVCGYTRTITHNYSKTEKDASQHWTVCSVCNTEEPGSRENHTPKAEDVLETPADCANAAVYKKVCSVCEAQIGATFPVGSPDASLHSGGTATCKDKAVCQHCSQPYGNYDSNNHVGTKKVEKNDTHHWEVCQACTAEVAGTKTGHSGGTATCKDKAVCTTCGEAYGSTDADNHVGSTKVEKDATQHWTVCESCSSEIAGTKTGHSGGTATCKDKAVCITCGEAYGDVDLTTHKGGKADCKNKAECDVCGNPYGEIDSDVHTGNVNVTPEVPADCKNGGWTEEIACADCGVVLTPKTPTEKKAHYIDTWTEVKPATESQEGEKKGKCTECGDEFTVATDKLATSVKAENILNNDGKAVEGAKIEAVGDTKLPENIAAGIITATPQEIKDFEEDAETKEMLAKVPEASDKKILGLVVYAIMSGDTYQDAASGDFIVDATANEKLPGKIKVTLPITADLSNYENLVVLTEGANGDLVKLEATIVNGTVVFETESNFNGIILMGSEKKAPAPVNPDVPQNGDSSEVVLYVSLALVSLLTLSAMFISKKSKASK